MLDTLKQRNQILAEKDLKVTANRELVWDVFLSHNHALALTDLEDLLPWADRASLFRSLKTFEKKGLIHPIIDGFSSTKYALCKNACGFSRHLDVHPHFNCEACEKTICLEKQEIIFSSLPEGAVLNNYSLIINGLWVSFQMKRDDMMPPIPHHKNMRSLQSNAMKDGLLFYPWLQLSFLQNQAWHSPS